MKLGRSEKLRLFIEKLGIDINTEIYSINHPTESNDRRDFQYSGFRIIVQITDDILSYKFHCERFRNTSLNGCMLASFMLFDSDKFHQNLDLFTEEVKKFNKTEKVSVRIFKKLFGLK